MIDRQEGSETKQNKRMERKELPQLFARPSGPLESGWLLCSKAFGGSQEAAASGTRMMSALESF